MSELKTTLKVAVDGSAAMAGIEGVKKSFQNLESSSISSAKNVSQGLDNVARSSSQSASTLTANARRVEKSLENQANRLSMTSAEYARHRAVAAGVSKDVYEPLVARIDAASRSTANLGMSAKATSAAMRNVPAQLTDIVVGLQGGQAPLTVLLQQGGQLKDMFGGVVPAFKALATTAIGMVSPLTLAAGAVIGLGAAYYSGAQESVRFGKAIIESGNYAGQTAASLGTLSAKVADATGSTVSNAAAVTASVVATGQLASSSLEMVATAAIQLEKNGGQAVEKTVEAFVSLGKNPAQAALALNETYNFLTLSVYEQIVALQKQGDQQGAVKLAMTTYADTVAARSKDVQENLGYIERAWRAVKGATVGAIDAAKGLGRDDTAQETLTGLEREARAREENVRLARAAGATLGQRELDAVATARSAVTAFKDQLTVREKIARAAGVSAEKEKERLAAGVKWAALEEQNLSKLKQREKAEKDIRDLGAKLRLDDTTIQAQVDASNERLKDPKIAAPKAYRDDAATKVLQQLKEQEASLRAQAEGETKISDAAKERAKFEQQIADIKEKKVLTAEQKSLLANQDAIRAQYDKNVAISEEVKQREALIKMDERSAQIQASIASSQASRQEQYDRTLSAYGLGDRAQRRVLSETGIRREFQRNQDQLNKATPESLLGSEKYLSESRKIADGQAAALDAQRQFYAEEDRLRGSWQLGFQNAFQNYADVASDAYRSSANVFGTVFGGMEDRLTTFISKGKVDFAGFADSIIADLARIYARQAISGLAGLIGQAFAPAAASSASAYSPGSDGYIPTVDVTGGRAIGGPVSAGNVYRVNESGEPELANVGGKQYLLMGNRPGAVTPMRALTGEPNQAMAPQVEFNLINQSSQPVQAKPGDMRFDGRRMIQDVFIVDMKTNGPMARAMKGVMA